MRSLSLGSALRLAMKLYRSNTLQVETAADGGPDRLGHLILGSTGINHPAAVGISPGDVQKGLAQSFMKIGAEFLETVFRIPTRQRPFQSPFGIQVQNQGQVGLEIIQHRAVDASDRL